MDELETIPPLDEPRQEPGPTLCFCESHCSPESHGRSGNHHPPPLDETRQEPGPTSVDPVACIPQNKYPVYRSKSCYHTTLILGIALVKITASNGNTQVYLALLYPGIMQDFISESAAKLLGTRLLYSYLNAVGISEVPVHPKGLL
ncbi:hypothetical protein J6590_101288 [Homalodisca vitripennis]|nr:hypothetical protein J6590_101288 [Homalodisca vitripennis]